MRIAARLAAGAHAAVAEAPKRAGGELTLVNPIRLDEAGETQLSGLGEVKNMPGP